MDRFGFLVHDEESQPRWAAASLLVNITTPFLPGRPSFSGPGVSRCGVSSRGRSLSELLPYDVW